MEKKARKKLVEVIEEYYVARDGTEFETVEQCLDYENTYKVNETRSQRVNLVIKPSTNEHLDELVRLGKIKSKNDLINFLLEQFIEQNK